MRGRSLTTYSIHFSFLSNKVFKLFSILTHKISKFITFMLYQSIRSLLSSIWQWIGPKFQFFIFLIQPSNNHTFYITLITFYYCLNKNHTIKQNIFNFLYRSLKLPSTLYHINHFQTKNYLSSLLPNRALKK
jgi:hypothetical protein